MFASAREMMNRDPLTITPDQTTHELADLLLNSQEDGACVVEDGKLVGVVTMMDLIFQEKRVKVPAIFAFMDAVIPLGRMGQMKEEIEKISGQKVRDIMSEEIFHVSPGSELAEIATLMVEKHITTLPVVEHDRLVGVITKRSLLEATFRPEAAISDDP